MPADCQIENCGVLASGRCARCGLAFCQSHQGFGPVDPYFASVAGVEIAPREKVWHVDRCAPCQTQVEEEREREETRREDERRKNVFVAANPMESFLRAMHRSQWNPGGPGDDPLVRELLPRLPTDIGFAPNIAIWFAQRASEAGAKPDSVARWREFRPRAFLRKAAWIEEPEEPAWVFHGGGTVPLPRSDPTIWADAAIFPDGRLLGSNDPQSRRVGDICHGGLNDLAVARMAAILGLA